MIAKVFLVKVVNLVRMASVLVTMVPKNLIALKIYVREYPVEMVNLVKMANACVKMAQKNKIVLKKKIYVKECLADRVNASKVNVNAKMDIQDKIVKKKMIVIKAIVFVVVKKSFKMIRQEVLSAK
mmetsp:Transcript_132400/g.197307  ORF Transcript_132400/g.197307 Transcript_132400/m.197307 type:complete len:126 (+) Transcript_132400:1517-1894(+)